MSVVFVLHNLVQQYEDGGERRANILNKWFHVFKTTRQTGGYMYEIFHGGNHSVFCKMWYKFVCEAEYLSSFLTV